jgi:hypothetical protein
MLALGHREANMKLAATILVVGVCVAPLTAQSRGRSRDAGFPPGQLPPPGLCRVWFDGRPPGQQPPPLDCRDAERIASRSRYAHVVYGDRSWRDDRYRNDSRYDDYRYDQYRDDRYQYNDRSYSGDRYAAPRDDWDASRYYRRDDRRYRPYRMGRNDRIYRGSDNRYYCRRDDGTSGLIIGGITGGVLGSIIAPGGSRTLGAIIGAGAGAAIGRAADDGDIVCR